MPNRIIRDGILRSIPVNSLTWAEEVFYRRLLNVVDDFGCFDADPRLLRPACYPMRLDAVREADISLWLNRLAATGLIALYKDARGSCILHVLNFNQRCRLKHRKYPEPPKLCIELAQKKLREMTVICMSHGGHMTAESYSNSYSDSNTTAGPDPAQNGGSVPPSETAEPPDAAQALFREAVAKLRGSTIQADSFAAWIKPLRLVGWDGGTVRLTSETPYHARYANEHYHREILGALQAVDPSVRKVEYLERAPVRPGVRKGEARAEP